MYTPMISSSTALIISQDETFILDIKDRLRQEFNLQIRLFDLKILKQPFRHTKPLFVIWDGRNPCDNWNYLLRWIREHLRGCPIIALFDESGKEIRRELQKMGINIFLDFDSFQFADDLNRHVSAILMDSN
ncbi:MAG: hypothetical protein AB1656_05820 [Candidatus Omnitrophota bacterium]